MWRDVLRQRVEGDASIVDPMLKSELLPDIQLVAGCEALTCGASVTDASIGWEETEMLITEAHQMLASGEPQAS